MIKDQAIEIRCGSCRRLLAKYSVKGEGEIQIQCRCKELNTVRVVATREPKQAVLNPV